MYNVINITEPTVVTFIPESDDSYGSYTHKTVAVVNTPEGAWLFHKPMTNEEQQSFLDQVQTPEGK